MTSALVPLDRLIALAVLSGKSGFTTMDPDDIASFPPIAGVSLPEHNCFEMLGSRAGDKRVTGISVSNGGPRLGWCWGGNPHSWLGMASAAGRIG